MQRAVVNGTARTVPDGTRLSDVVASVATTQRGIAVAVNGEVVPRARWDDPLADDARIEIVTAVQGG